MALSRYNCMKKTKKENFAAFYVLDTSRHSECERSEGNDHVSKLLQTCFLVLVIHLSASR